MRRWLVILLACQSTDSDTDGDDDANDDTPPVETDVDTDSDLTANGETDTAWVILRLKEKKEPSPAEFDQSKLGLAYSLTVGKQNSAYEGWSKRMRESSNVKVHPVALTYDDQARSAARNPGK